jgi:hypothetical protein
MEIPRGVARYFSLDAPAFNGSFDAHPVMPPSRRDALLVAAGLIWRF